MLLFIDSRVNRAWRFLLIFSIFLCSSFYGKSQVTLFTEDFEGAAIPAGWSVQTYSGNNGWGAYWYDYNSGQYSAACFPNNGNANAWLFTKAVSLTAGTYYELKYYIKTTSNTQVKVTVGNAPDFQSQPTILRNTFTANSGFTLVKDTFIVSQAGLYYIGFNNYSALASSSSSLVDDITLTDLNLPNCSTVSAGTISGVSSICANTNFTISNINATNNLTGLRYAWQRSTDGTNWSNLYNGYTYKASIQVSQSVPTWYRLTDTCINSGASAISNQLFVNTTSFLNCYCVPASVSCAFAITFTNVNILNTSINNTSSCATGAYSNFSTVGNASVYRNQQIYVQHTVGNTGSNEYTVGIWADLDHSGSFDENEFSVSGPFYTTTGTSQFLIPVTALLGETRLRIKVRPYTAVGALSACDALGGEREDYKITIADPPNCNASVSAGTITAPAQICPNTNFNITAANTTIYQGQVRYAWQRSTDNVNWTNITNSSYLVNPITVSENVSSWYRLTDTCLVSGLSSISNAVQVTASSIFTCYCTPQTATCTTYGIDSVSFNTIHNSSTCITGGYSNFTGISTTVTNGLNLPVYIKLRPTSSVIKYAGVWIDFNRNGRFESTERVFENSTTGINISGNINIPYNVNPGETMMRVAVSSGSIYDGCPWFSTGETEDYKVILNVVNPVNKKFCYYVKKTAVGLNDGTSWTNAYTSLATAFTNIQTGDTVKIAKGIYTPGAANTNSFVLKDSVVILGGYPDTGNPTDADRNLGDNQSVMSGEIGSAGTNTDNTKLILTASAAKGFKVDGLIIENGYCSPSAEYGPIYFNAATGTIQNSVIRNNYNAYNGCAINANDTKLNLQNSFIENNSSSTNYQTPCLLKVTAKSNISVINTVIAKNKAEALLNQAYSTVKMTNCTVFKNYGFSNIHDTSSLTIENSIFYFNGNNFMADSAEFVKDFYSNISLSNTITEVYNVSAANYSGQNPKFIDTTNIAGADNKYFNADDGLRLTNPCSPAINTGNNSLAAAIATDISGAPRIRNGIVDLGAYEVQAAIATQPAVVYVKRNAVGANNGSSWVNAFTDLQAAFASCSDTIKVAKGVYPVSGSNPLANFRLSNHRVLMGGYPDAGNPGNSEINTVLYPTQIDGQVSAGVKSCNIITSINNDSTCRMIGFEIMNSAVSTYPSRYSTFKVAYKSAPYFENIRISSLSNQANDLIAISDSSKPTFRKCNIYNGFTRVSSDDGYRGISVSKGSVPLFIKSYFGKDTASAVATTDLGAQFLFYYAGGKFDSCLFYRNMQDVIEAQYSYPVFQNSDFTKNYGRSIYNIASTLQMLNCNFNDSAGLYYTSYEGGAIANVANSVASFNHCRFNNTNAPVSAGVCYNQSSTAVFKNCVFNNCNSGSDAGAFKNRSGRLKLFNCISINATANSGTSFPQSQFLLNTEGSSAEIINSTILSGTFSSKTLITSSDVTDTLKLYNSILWRSGYSGQNINLNDDILTANNNNSAICDIRNSMLYKQKNTALLNTTVGINPKLTDLTNTEGIDAMVYTTDDGFKPCSCSPAVNGGNNSLNPEATDILGLGRIFNSTIDIGAYELQSAPTLAKAYYVKENAAAGGNGLTWSTAYNRLQTAVLNSCADTIRIAKGTYKPALSNRDTSFNIYKNLVMMGGYPNTGNPTDAVRNAVLNPTVLSGDIGASNDSTDNSYSVMQVHCSDSTVLIDGIVIEKGNYDKPGSVMIGGGGIHSSGTKKLTINNCIIRNNYGKYGGGLYTIWSNLDITKTVFTNNNAYQGGGFYVRDYYTPVNNAPWAPILNFRNSVLAYNKGCAAYIYGAGTIAYQNNNRFENAIVYKNEGSQAGLWFSNNPYVSVINCLFARNNNTTINSGVSINTSNTYFTLTLNTTVFNTIFYNNTAMGMFPGYQNTDFNWQNHTTQNEVIPYQNLAYSAVTSNQTGSGSGLIGSGTVSFLDVENGAGADGIWMTEDDGLLAISNSNSIDKGSNNYVSNIPLDILDSARIKNAIVDMGSYETSFDRMVELCPSATSFTLVSTISGTSYQWQSDNGTGTFTNLTNNVNYSGTNTQTLQILNPPSAWYGYGFRCILQNGTYDRISHLKFTATWTGAVSTAWEDPANWNCGKVPDNNTDVIINSGNIVIHSNVIIRTLFANAGANITVSTGNTLTILH